MVVLLRQAQGIDTHSSLSRFYDIHANFPSSPVKRLHTTIKTEIFAGKNVKTLPIWLTFRVLFHGEAYDDLSEPTTHNINVDLERGDVSPTDAAEERLRRYYIKRGLPEAFEMFKKGGR